MNPANCKMIQGFFMNPSNLCEALVLHTKQILKKNPQIWICKSDSMDLFQVVIDKSNQVNPQIQICESGHLHNVWFVLICKDLYMNPAALIISHLHM